MIGSCKSSRQKSDITNLELLNLDIKFSNSFVLKKYHTVDKDFSNDTQKHETIGEKLQILASDLSKKEHTVWKYYHDSIINLMPKLI